MPEIDNSHKRQRNSAENKYLRHKPVQVSLNLVWETREWGGGRRESSVLLLEMSWDPWGSPEVGRFLLQGLNWSKMAGTGRMVRSLLHP